MKNSKASKRTLGCLGTGLGILILLPILGYFLLKSPWFLRSVVLPQVESTADIELEFEEIDFDPFHRLKVESVTLKAPAQGVSGNLHSLTARYDFLDVVKGQWNIKALSVVQPDLKVDLKKMGRKEEDDETPDAVNKKGTAIRLRNVVVENATIDLVNGEESIRITGNLNLPEFFAGGKGDMSTSGTYRIPAPLEDNPQQPRLSGTFDAGVSMSLNRELLPTSLEANVEVRTDEAEEYKPVKLTFTTEAAYDPEQEVMTVSELSGSGTYDQREVLTLSLETPAKLDFTQDMPLASNTRIGIRIQDINLANLPFVQELPLRKGMIGLEGELLAEKQGGKVSANLEFQFQNLGGTLAGKETDSWDLTGNLMAFAGPKTVRISESTLHVNHVGEKVFNGSLEATMDSDLEKGEASVSVASLKVEALRPFVPQMEEFTGRVQGKTHIKWAPDQFRLSETSLNLRQEGETVFSALLDATADPDFMQGSAEILLEQLNVYAFQGFFPDSPDLSGHINGKTDIEWSTDQWVIRNTHLTVRELRRDGAAALPSPLNLGVRANRDPQGIYLKDLYLAWPETGSYTNRISVSGDLNPNGKNGPGGTLKLTGGAVDLTPWFPQTSVETDTGYSGEETSDSDAWLPKEEPSLFPLPVDGLQASMTFARVKLPEVELKDLRIESEGYLERAEIPTLRFAMLEGEVNGSASISREGNLAAYSMQAALSPTNIQPLLKKLQPDEAGTTKGIVEGEVKFHGRGVTAANVLKHFKGEAELDLRDGRVFLLKEEGHRGMIKIESLTHLILDTLAATLKLPPEELKAPPVTRLTLRLDVNNGLLDIREFEGRNQNLRLRTEGQVRLKDDVKASELNRLPIKIGVSEDLAERAKVYQEKRFQDGYVNLPVFLNVEGTLEDPGIDINRSVITGLVLTGVGENSGIGDAKVQSVLKGIGGLLSEGELPLDLFDSGKESEQ